MKLFKTLKSYSTAEWLILLGIVSFNAPWFVWGYGLSVILQYFSILALFILFSKQNRLNGNRGGIILFLLLLYFVVGQIINDVHLSYAFIAFAYFLATRISKDESINVINLLTSYVFISILIPLPLWLIHQYVTPIPTIGMIDVGAMKGGAAYMENHFFFVTYAEMDAMRFYSWYDEPGVLGTLAPFILFANKFNMKDWRIPVILVGSLFTFSMAYYVLTLLGWLYTSRRSFKSLALTLVGIFVLGYVLYTVLSDNLAFQESVVSRILNPEENGLDSRNSYEKEMVWNKVKNSGQLIFGLGSGAMNELGGISTSYKSFIMEFGYVGCFILLLAYYSLIRRKNTLTLFTLFLFALSFLQRPQLFTAGWFLLFACVIGTLTYTSNKTQVHEEAIS